MDAEYVEQKLKEVLTFINSDITFDINHKKKFIRLILESVYLCGKVDGVQSAREILKSE